MHSILLVVRPCVPNPMTGRSSPKLSLVPIPSEQIDKSAQFKRWLALFFIEKGKYKITEKGYEELAPQEQRQNLEFGEPVSDRKREPRMEERRSLTRKEIREAVARKVEEMLGEGRAGGLYNNEYIIHKSDWQSKEVRVTVIKKLLEFLGVSPERLDKLREELDQLILQSAREEPTDTKRMQEILVEIRSNLERIRKLSFNDFRYYGASGLLKHYKNSPHLALVEAVYAYSLDEIKEQNGQFGTDKIYPWEMNKVGNEFWYDKEIRIAACKWLIWKLGKQPKEITQDDFKNNGLSGILAEHYKGSPYLALVEAFYAYSLDEIKEQNGQFGTDKIYPWEMNKVGNEFYKDKEIRIAATKWLIWKLNKNPKEITQDDFGNNGLHGLLNYYKGSPYLALVAAGYAYSLDEIKEHTKTGFKTDKIYPWEMNRVPSIYDDKEIRIATTKWLIWKLEKEPREIIADDFKNNGLGGLLNYYKGSPYLALVEVGLVRQTDEAYMRERLHIKMANLLHQS